MIFSLFHLQCRCSETEKKKKKRKVTSEQGGTSLQHDPECGGAMAGWHFRLKTLLVSTWKMDTGGQLASLSSGGVRTQS